MLDKFENISRQFFSVMFLAIGLSGFGASIYLIKMPPERVQLPELETYYSNDCTDLLKSNGFSSTYDKNNQKLFATSREYLGNSRETWKKVPHYMAYCRGFTLESACIGNGCVGNSPGVYLEFSYDEK